MFWMMQSQYLGDPAGNYPLMARRQMCRKMLKYKNPLLSQVNFSDERLFKLSFVCLDASEVRCKQMQSVMRQTNKQNKS